MLSVALHILTVQYSLSHLDFDSEVMLRVNISKLFFPSILVVVRLKRQPVAWDDLSTSQTYTTSRSE